MPGGPALVTAAARAGGLGFVAAGDKTPQALVDDITTVAASSVPFGVNLFAPNPVPVDATAFRRYADLIAVEAERYGVTVDGAVPVEDDDGWHDKLDVLRAHPVPVVSDEAGTSATHRAALADPDPERVHLWAGTGYRHATEGPPPRSSPASPRNSDPRRL